MFPLSTPCSSPSRRDRLPHRRSARELGLKTVAVYSDADACAAHVEMADAAVRLGPAPAAESYLAPTRSSRRPSPPAPGDPPRLRVPLGERAIRRGGGAGRYRVRRPTPDQLRVFGNKHTAREAARAVGVPLVPGSGLLESVEEALAEAERIGYPVMLKAVGGGGGIGMQACFTRRRCARRTTRCSGWRRRTSRRRASFLERFVARARHIEVQVFGDGAGRTVSLGTRDCSLQRRNQKVVEGRRRRACPTTHRAVAALLPRSGVVGELPFGGHRRVRVRRGPRRRRRSGDDTRLQVELPSPRR